MKKRRCGSFSVAPSFCTFTLENLKDYSSWYIFVPDHTQQNQDCCSIYQSTSVIRCIQLVYVLCPFRIDVRDFSVQCTVFEVVIIGLS